MVVSLAPWAWTASTLQLFTALPSMRMVQAPHWAVSQPTWVPVSCRLSRRNSTSRVRDSTSAETGPPFTVRETEIFIDTPPRELRKSEMGELQGCETDSTPKKKSCQVRLFALVNRAAPGQIEHRARRKGAF